MGTLGTKDVQRPHGMCEKLGIMMGLAEAVAAIPPELQRADDEVDSYYEDRSRIQDRAVHPPSGHPERGARGKN